MKTAEHITLAEASRLIPGRPSLSTLHRWVTRGIRGHRLGSIRVGAKRLTTRQAVEQFLAEQNDSLTHDDAEAELAAEGL